MDIPNMLLNWPIQALAAIIAGVAVLLVPRILNYAVAAYLLVAGTLGVVHAFYGHVLRPQAIIALVAGVFILIKPNLLNYVVGIYLILFGLLEAGILRF